MPDRGQRLWRGVLEPQSAALPGPMPIGSFIGATVPLGDDSPVLPGGDRLSNSRFVVRYFRRARPASCCSADARSMRRAIRRTSRHISTGRSSRSIQVKDVEIAHQWAGYVGITMPRKPYVREVMPNVISAGGYSGHGVMLANFMGKLYAETVSGNRDQSETVRGPEDTALPRRPALARAAAVAWRSTGMRCATGSDDRLAGRLLSAGTTAVSVREGPI